jgi:hypothetical protein
MTTTKLPPLPKPVQAVCVMVSAIGSTHREPAKSYYTEAQLQAYGQACADAAIEQDRAQRGEPAIATKDCLWARNGNQCCPATSQPERKPHTEAEVQEIVDALNDPHVSYGGFVETIRRILGVPKP